MQILILGGGGFIGSHLIDGLLARSSHRVCAYDLFGEKLSQCADHDRLEFVPGDIRSDHDRLDRLVRDADLTIDLIAHANPSLYVREPLDVVRLNFDWSASSTLAGLIAPQTDEFTGGTTGNRRAVFFSS